MMATAAHTDKNTKAEYHTVLRARCRPLFACHKARALNTKVLNAAANIPNSFTAMRNECIFTPLVEEVADEDEYHERGPDVHQDDASANTAVLFHCPPPTIEIRTHAALSAKTTPS
jgi:hypothetical protein